ncbi:MAG: efflux RND transporter periplasmic adaptor subunit [Novosphingobium sp.]
MAGLAAALGLGAGSLLWRDTPERHADDAHQEEASEHASKAAFVALTPATASKAGVEITSIGRGGGAELQIPGRVTFAPNAEAAIGAPLGGVVETVHVAPGSRVRAGDAIVTIRSPEGAALRASSVAARAELDAARAALRRETRLYQERVTARQDWEAARAASIKAEASLRAAEAQLSAAGSPGASGRTTVRTLVGGVVTSVSTAPGAVAQQGTAVAQVADTGRTELVFDAPAAAFGAIVTGSRIRVSVAGNEEVEAVVTAVSPQAATGGARVRARPLGPVPPAGTPLSGRIVTGDADAVVVPSDAIQTLDGRPVVFVVEAGGFRATPVVPGASAAGRTEILKGLKGSERIAGRGAFLLKAELSRGEAEHEH